MRRYFACRIHRRRKLPYTLRSPHCTFCKRRLESRQRKVGAPKEQMRCQPWRRMNLSGIEDRGSGTWLHYLDATRRLFSNSRAQ